MTLEETLIQVTTWLSGLKDKQGKPVILHTLRVALAFEDLTSQIVGLLHDVVEDTPITINHLKISGYSNEICTAVQALTRDQEEPYEEYISRVKNNELAARIKVVDLVDNLGRVESLSDKEEIKRLKKRYYAALDVLDGLSDKH